MPSGQLRDGFVQFGDGSQIEVKQLKYSKDRLLAFLRLETEQLTDLQLSKKPMMTGSTITQIAFHLASNSKNRLGVVLGRVVEHGVMIFPSFGNKYLVG